MLLHTHPFCLFHCPIYAPPRFHLCPGRMTCIPMPHCLCVDPSQHVCIIPTCPDFPSGGGTTTNHCLAFACLPACIWRREELPLPCTVPTAALPTFSSSRREEACYLPYLPAFLPPSDLYILVEMVDCCPAACDWMGFVCTCCSGEDCCTFPASPACLTLPCRLCICQEKFPYPHYLPCLPSFLIPPCLLETPWVRRCVPFPTTPPFLGVIPILPYLLCLPPLPPFLPMLPPCLPPAARLLLPCGLPCPVAFLVPAGGGRRGTHYPYLPPAPSPTFFTFLPLPYSFPGPIPARGGTYHIPFTPCLYPLGGRRRRRAG